MRDWSDFFAAQVGRDPRPTLQSALGLRAGPPGLAIDLGCGEGSDTRYLLSKGWAVHAIDGADGVEDRVRAGVPDGAQSRLTVENRTFETIRGLPVCDMLYSGFALPFCRPDAFPDLWAAIREAITPSGWFVGELFGPRDTWSGNPEMNFHDRAEVDGLFDGLELIDIVEDERDGTAHSGPKHWHVFHIIARAA